MIWTREAPTKPGWYWWRHDAGTGETIVKINFHEGVPYASMAPCKEWRGEWSSTPIPEPAKQKVEGEE